MAASVCKRFLVSGRVQGVFFRASTAREATRLGVNGWALNLPDGRVEVLACGAADAVAGLQQWLQRGPPQAQVSHVEVDEADMARCAHLGDFRTG